MKFKVWDKRNERMIEWIDLDFSKDNGEDFITVFEPTGFVRDAIISQILLQSTGLFDRNGKEIYEGDVVKIDNHPLQVHKAPFSGLSIGLNINGNYVVEYSTEDMAYFIGNWKTREVIRHSEVIGNKYEHPHLLEEE
ncbi:YopX family protein [Mammaliicoccus sp. P-M59]|uniref:YopX family protein n=1 Tax=Mammaliicoccus sp. P-M59 TaxID=2898718 RepID=UPI001EFAEBD4|nr:YopX family protein [Mammaliicoccus sp. P-M59]